MNILVVSQYFWPENFRINELVSELVYRGHTVTVLTGIPNYPDGKVFADYQSQPGAYNNFSGANVIRVPIITRGTGKIRLMLNFASFALSASILGAWKIRGRKIDAIFTYEPSPISVGIPSAIIRKLKGAPQIFWVFDLWPETLKAVNAVHNRWVLSAVEHLVRFVYRHCDLILAQSKSFVKDILRYAPSGQKVEYFPAWSDEVFQPGAIEPAAEISPQPNVFTIMFAGNIGEAQDFPAILDAAERLRDRKDIRWIVVGDGRMAEWVKEQITKRKLDQSVLMLGRYPLERMPSFFVHADTLLVSLKPEPVFSMTIPGKMQSYFAAGIPVLAMLDGEGARIVEESKAGLTCSAGNSNELAKNVEKMAAMDASARQKMGENGRQLCDREFSRDRLIDQLDSWLLEMTTR